MILYHVDHVQPILEDIKIKTRRRGMKRWNVNSIHRAKTKMIRQDYFALLRILTVHREPLGAMTEKDAWEEGGYTLSGYRGVWEKINGKGSWDPDLVVWVVQFERVFNQVEICRHCWQFTKCTSRSCCVKLLFDIPDRYVSSGEVRQFCCRQRCRHDREYHDKFCPISLAKAGREYVQFKPEVHTEKDGGGYIIRRLTDYFLEGL